MSRQELRLADAQRLHLTANRPQEGGHLARDRRGNHRLQLAAVHELAIAAAQAPLGFPGDVAHRPRLVGLPLLQLPALAGREAVGPGTLDQHAPYAAVAGLGDAATPDPLTCRALARH